MIQTPPSQGFSRRSSPAFAIGGIGYEPDPVKPTEGFNQVPFAGWVCFHCGERFTTQWGAQRHFGTKPEEVAECLKI